MFEEKFYKYVTEGDSITCEVDGFKCTATVYNDDYSEAPWIREEGHGVVSDWTTPDCAGPGDRILIQEGRSCRFYNIDRSIEIALADGWGVEGGRHEGETKEAYARRAVEHDFAILKAWCEDEWSYCGVAVTVSLDGVPLTGKYDHALWGVE